MNSSITLILFYLTYLFSTPFTFISQESNSTINLNNKTVEIEYIGLETPNKEVNKAVASLKEMNLLTKFDIHNDNLKFSSINISPNEKSLNAIIKFSFEDLNQSLKTLSFFIHPNGNYVHPILGSEKVISSNGIIIKEKGISFVMWKRKTKIIKLKLKHLKLKENHLLNMVS